MSYDLAKEILELKQQKGAVILSHYYEDGAIQDIADYVGDSFYLAQMGQKVPQQTILLAGVVFMAESVKILNPEKTVLVPDLNAGCSLVTGSPFADYLDWRLQHPEAIAVTYINSSAAVKSISDVIVTSSNAKKIIEAIPAERKILFGPDKNLGKYLAKETNRDFELWPGTCEVHVLFSAKKLHALIQQNPDAVVIAHPECDPEVLHYATVIGSTSRLLQEVEKNPAKKFIVATETGIFHQMKKNRPDAELIQAPEADGTCGCNNCPYMKLNTLEKIFDTLTQNKNQIQVEARFKTPARQALQRMLDVSAGLPTQWPEGFRLA